MSNRKDHSELGGSKSPRRLAARGPKRRVALLGIESLEARTLLAVTPVLTNNILDITLGAANDSATVSVSGTTLDVFDGTTHSPFALASVFGINAHGMGAANQKVTLHSPVRLTQSLATSQLTSATIDGMYQASSIDVQATEIHVNNGLLSTRTIASGADPLTALSTGNSGSLLLTAGLIDVTAGSKLLANGSTVFTAGNVKLVATDSQVGENVKSTASIIVNGATVRGGDILIDATAKLAATSAKLLDALGANIANLDVTSTAAVTISGASEVTASASVAIGAHSTAGTTSTALALTTATDTAKDAAFARTALTSSAIAHVTGSSKLTAGGMLTISATNDTNSTTTADGSASGANAGGASVAIGTVTVDTEAYADGSSTLNAAQLRLSADSKTKATTTAKATSKAVTQNTPATQGTLAAQNANASGGPIALAAALGVTTLNDKTLAYLATTAPITATGDLKIDSTSTAASYAVADASTAAPGGKASGEGVAVAVEHGTEINRAYIGGTGQVIGKGIAITATTSNAPNSFDAQALSGISKKNSALEGAAAFNVSSSANEAFLAKNANVNAKSGDVTITATGDVTSSASARPAPGAAPGSVAKGMGASIAVNVFSNTTRAELEDNATLTGANNLKLAATGHEAMTTVAESGADPTAAGTTFSGFSAAVGISVLNAATTDRIGTAGSKLSIAGSLSADATHKAEVANSVGGASAGQGVLGAALALTVTSAQTTTTLARDLDALGGDVTLSTHANLASAADAKASARGGRPNKPGSTPADAVDKDIAAQLFLADSQAAAGGVPGTNGATAPKAKTGGGGATAAGALAIDLITASKSEAALAPGRTIKSGGLVSLIATNDTDARAKAQGNTTDAAATGVGVGIAVNAVSGESDRAIIGAGATVQAKGLTLDAHMSPGGDGTNVLRAEAVSGVGSKETGVAGSLAINAVKLTTEAVVGSGAQVTLSGGDLNLTATSKTSAPASARPGLDANTGGVKGLGLSFAVNVIEENTRAEVEDMASVVGANNVGLNATSSDDLSTTAQTGIQATGSAFAAAAAITTLTAPTTARIGVLPSASLPANGNVSLSATHGGLMVANSGGESVAASGTSLGASVSVVVATVDTVATIARDVNAAGGINLTALGGSASDATAKATSKGGKADDGSAPQTAANDETKSDLTQADSAAASVGAKGSNGAVAPKSETSSGGTAVAGALAVDIVVSSRAEASIAPSRNITSGGIISLLASNDTDAHAKADGSATSANSDGVGVGIAINAATNNVTRADIGANSNVTAKGLSVQTAMTQGGDGTNTLGADALSGAGAKKTGVAGAVAIGIAKVTDEAFIGSGTTLNLSAPGDVKVTAAGKTNSTVTAKPLFDGATGTTKGIGVSFALNIVEDDTRAEVEKDVKVLGVRDLTISAISDDTMTTVAQTGGQSTNGGTGFGAAVAVGVLNAPTTARIGTLQNAPTTSISGKLDIGASHISSASTNSGATASSSDTAIGASVALTFTTVDTVATTLRDLSAAGDVTIHADSASAGDSKAVASGKGGKAADNNAPPDAVDQAGKTEQGKADQQAAAAGVGGTNGASMPKAKNDQGTTAAAALAVNVAISSRAEASIPSNLTITSGGTLTLAAKNDTDAHAGADATAVDAGSTGVGIAIGINAVPNAISRAIVAPSAHVNAKGLTLKAETGHGQDTINSIGADTLSGAGAKQTGFAGSLAINVAKFTTEAVLDSSSTASLTGGDVLLVADDRVSSIVSATPSKDGGTGEDKGIGVSAGFSIVEDNTRAEIVNFASITGAKGVNLSARSGDSLTTKAETGAQSTGGTAVAASLAASALTSSTKARLGSGAPLGATGDIVIEAGHIDKVATAAGGDGKGAQKAIGISVALTYANIDTTATTDRDINNAAAVTFRAESASASEAIATASEAGGKDDPNAPPDGAKQQGDAGRAAVNEKASDAGIQGTGANSSTPDAKTTNGDSIAVAGALALDIVPTAHANATIPDGRTIKAAGPLKLLAANDVDAHAKADASAKGNAKSGVGVALAITVAPDTTTLATIGKTSLVTASGVTLSAGMSPANDSTHVVGSEAISGASASDKAGAGALALTVFTPQTIATVGGGSSLELLNCDLNLSATEATHSLASATPGKDKISGKSLGVGLSFGFNIVEPTTTAEIPNTVNVTNPANVHLAAISDDVLYTAASTGAAAKGGNGGTGFAASVGASALTSKTTARLGAGPKLITTNGGAVIVEAAHHDLIKTEVGAESTGDDTSIGVSLALGYESVTTVATTDRDIDAKGAVTFASHNASSTETIAKASGVGGKESGAQNNAGVKSQGDTTRNTLNTNAKAGASNAQGADPNAKIPEAKNSDGGSVAFAGAIALDLPVKVQSLATIPGSHSVKAGGLLTVSADNDVDAKSKADGTAVGMASTGIGVAVAITVAPDVKTMATIGDLDTITAKGVNVSATMSPVGDGVNTIRADATSGASASDKAVSGAFAMDIFLEKADATIGANTPVDAGGGDLSLTATEATESTVNAVPAISNGGPGMPDARTVTGVGVAVALNIVEIEAKAAIADNDVVIGAHDAALFAHSTDNLHTTATAGNSAMNQADDTGAGGEAAISIFIGKTDATIGAGGSVSASHDLSARAEHVDTVTTIGDGQGAGKGTAVGIAIAIGYVDAQTTATVAENVDAGNAITFDAKNATASATSATASAKGAKNSNSPQNGVDQSGQKNRNLGDSYASDYNGQTTDATKKNPQAKSSNGSVAVAGALALNIVANSKAVASTADNRSVHATNGALSITAENDTDASAGASASATEKSNTGVGVAVALNLAHTVLTSATVGKNSDIQGKGITIAAGMSDANDKTNFVSGVATSGASASEDAGAGALGMTFFFPTTEAVAKGGAKLDAKGGDVFITADSKTSSIAGAIPAHEVSGKATGVGISIAIGAVEETTRAELEDNAKLIGADDFTVIASSRDDSSVTAEAGARVTSGDAGTGAAAFSVVIPRTIARVGVGVGNDITTTGDVIVLATHDGKAAAKTEGDSNGGDTVVGISIAVNYLESDTTADIHRSMIAGKSFTIAAHTEASGAADAKASAGGAKGDDGNAQSNGVDMKSASQRHFANNQIQDNGGQKASTSDDTTAKTSKGGVSVAGALGLNIVHVHSVAAIPDNLTVNASNGKLTVSAWNDADARATASGEATGKSKTGVGVAVAINYVDATAVARIGKDTINAKGVLVEATQGNGIHKEDYYTEATSGSGAKTTGVAGSLALNLVKDNTHDAWIASDANIHAGNGDVIVQAVGATNNTAKATPVLDAMNDGGKTGVGVSAAANIVLKTTHAEIEDNASLVDAGAFIVRADSANAYTTEAKTGSKGSDTAVGISAGVLYAKDDVLARVGTGPALNAKFDAEVSAHIIDLATTDTSSAEVGQDTAVGLSIAVGILRVTAEQQPPAPFTANASLNRDLSSAFGSISVTIDTTATSAVSATASAVSVPTGFDGGKDSDGQTSDQFGFANSLSGENESSNSTSVASNEQTGDGATQGNAQSGSQKSTGVAAAIGVNVELVHVGAYVSPNRTLTASGPVTVRSTAEVDGSATGLAGSIAVNDGSTTVSASVAVNVPFVHNHVLIGDHSHITSGGITVAAMQAPGTTDDFMARALAGAGSGGNTGAGAAGLNVAEVETTAIVNPFATLSSMAGITVSASNDIRLQNWVGGVSVGDGTGVGLGIALNILTDHITTALISNDATLDSAGIILVSASASLKPVENSGIPGDPGSLAFGGTGTSGTAVAGSILVDVFGQKTHAEIGTNAHINTNVGLGALGQSVIVTADSDVAIRDGAGGLAISTGGTGIGAGLLVSVLTEETKASIDAGAVVNAGGDLVVSSSAVHELFGLGVAASIAKGAAVTLTAEVFVPNITTTANIGTASVVTANGNVVVAAYDDVSAEVYGGAVAASTGSGGFGAEVAVLSLTVLTEAFIGTNSKVTSRGRTAAYDLATGEKDMNGKEITKPVHGTAVSAVAYEDVTMIAAGGAAADSAAVAGSVAVAVFDLNTRAHINRGATIDATDGKPGTGPSVHVGASDRTDLTSAAGSLAIGGNAAVGLAADVGYITKDTLAYSDAPTVDADRDVIVKATSAEKFSLFGISGAASGGASVIAAATVYVVDVTTKAYIGNSMSNNIGAAGNVQVAARESLDLLDVAGGIAAGSTAGVGASAGIPIISKTTEAFIGDGSTVNALGLGGTIDADTGRFGVAIGSYNAKLADVAPTNSSNSDRKYTKDQNNKDVGLTPGGQLSGDRAATPETQPMRGVAVTATNRDDVIVIGAGGSFGGTAGVAVSGAVNVFTNTTTAHVDEGVTINKTSPGAALDQSVRIAAGNDLSFLGIAAALAGAGTAAASAGGAVLVANETTTAYSADGSSLFAKGDFYVESHSAEDTLTIAATLSGSGGVSITGAVSVVVLNNLTQAHIGSVAATDAAGARADASGNIVIAASDDSTHLAIAGGIAVGGLAGLGASAGITVFNKDTAAFVGTHANVNANGFSPAISGVIAGTIDNSNGTFNTLGSFKGLAVQARSSEHIVQAGAAFGGGVYVGIGGGVSVEMFNAITRAYIGDYARVNNFLEDRISAQSVNVAAVDDVRDFSLGVGGTAGFAAVGAGIDIGIVRNDTTGSIGQGARVYANGDVDVIGLSNEDVTTYAVRGAGGLAGLAGAVSVWSIGSAYTSSYQDSDGPKEGTDEMQVNGSLGNAEGAGNSFQSVTDRVLKPGNDDQSNPLLTPTKGVDKAKTGTTKGLNDNTQSGKFNAVVKAPPAPHGTSAIIHNDAQVRAGHDIGVYAADRLVMNVNVVSVAIGFVGLGASVAVVTIHGQVHADVLENVTLQAGGDIAVSGLFTESLHGLTISGAGGVAGIGGQIILINDDSVQTATIGANSTIVQAGNIGVLAGAFRNHSVESYGVALGFVAGGVTYLEVNLTGETTAAIADGVEIGEVKGKGVGGNLTVAALASNMIKDNAFALAVGAGSVSGHYANTTITPTVSATIDNDAKIKVGGTITVGAVSFGDATADILNISGGGLSMGLMVSKAIVSPTIKAEVGNSELTAGNSIAILGSHNYAGNNPATDGKNPAVKLGAHAHSDAPGASVISGTGVITTAEAKATVASKVASGATLIASGDVGVTAKLSNFAVTDAAAETVSGFGLGVLDLNATATGQADACLDGTVAHAGSVHVATVGSGEATTKGTALGIAFVGSAQVASVTANASPTLTARIGNGAKAAVINADNDIAVSSTDDSSAKADGLAVAIAALGVSFGLVESTATVTPHVSATVGAASTLTSVLGAVTVAAGHNTSGLGGAHATGDAPSGGLAAVSGTKVKADSSAVVTAVVGKHAVLDTRGNIAVTATSTNNAQADAKALDFGVLLAVGGTFATATANGSTVADLEGDVTKGMNLTVSADGTNEVITESQATSGSLFGAVAVATSSATANPTTTARIGDGVGILQGPKVHVSNNITLGADSLADSKAHGKTTSVGGLVGIGVVSAKATTAPHTSATVGAFADVETSGGSIDVHARHNADKRVAATADAESPGVGLVAANGAVPTATSTAVTLALVEHRVKLTALKDVTIATEASGIVEAQAKALSIGLVAFGTTIVKATSNGETHTTMDGTIDADNAPVSARSTDSAVTGGTSTSAGIVAADGVISTATVATKTIAEVGESAASGSVKARGLATLSATAEETSKADAKAANLGGLLSIGISAATATTASEVGAVLWHGSSILGDGGIKVTSSLTLPIDVASAQAHSDSPSAGFVAATGATSDALSTPTVYARADKDTKLNSKADIEVSTHAKSLASADASSLAVGALSAGASIVHATSSADSRASVLGKIDTGRSLLVSSNGDDRATASGEAAALSLGLSAGGTFVHALVQPISKATLGNEGDVDSIYLLGKTVTVEAKQAASAHSQAGSFALGLAVTDSTVAPVVEAVVARSATVLAGGGDLKITADFDGSVTTDAVAHATGGGVIAGIQSTTAKVDFGPIVSAHAEEDAILDSTGDVTISATSHSNASTTARGSSFAAFVGAGGTSAQTAIEGSTDAFTHDVKHINARLNVNVLADDSAHADSHATALAGGVVGVAGSGAVSKVERSSRATLDTRGGLVKASGAVTVSAAGNDAAISLADGDSAGAFSVGLSSATSISKPTVTATIDDDTPGGGDTKVVSTKATTVTATGTSDVESRANTSANGGGGVEGTGAIRFSDLIVLAHVGAGASITAGAIDIGATSTNTAYGYANGEAGGAFGVGSQLSQTDLSGKTIAKVENTSAAHPNHLEATTGIAIHALGDIEGNTHTDGGAGGLLGAGGAEDHFLVHSPLVYAGIGDNTNVQTDGDLELKAQDSILFHTKVSQGSGGGIAVDEAVADAQVSGPQSILIAGEAPYKGELLLTELGHNVKGNVGNLKMHSFQTDVAVYSSASAEAYGAGASATAKANTFVTTNSIVHVASGTDINAANNVDLLANGPNNIYTSTDASATAGVLPASFAFAKADNKKETQCCVIVESGVHFGAVNVDAKAGADPAIGPNDLFHQDAGATVYLPLPFFGISVESGSQTNESCVDFDATVTLHNKKKKHSGGIGSDGTINELIGLEVFDADGMKQVGDRITGPVTVRTVVRDAEPGGHVLIHATDGDTSGDSAIEYNPYSDLEFINDSPFEVKIANISNFDKATPRIIHEGGVDQALWTYSLASTPADTTVKFLSTNRSRGGFRLEGSINAPTADTTIETAAGSIYAQLPIGTEGLPPSVFTRTLALQAPQGQVGDFDRHFHVRFNVEPGKPSGFEGVITAWGIYLDATFFSNGPTDIAIGDFHGGNGPIIARFSDTLDGRFRPVNTTWHAGTFDSDVSSVILTFGSPDSPVVNGLVLEDAIRAPLGEVVVVATGAVSSAGRAQVLAAPALEIFGSTVGTADEPILIDQSGGTDRDGLFGHASAGGFHVRSVAGPIRVSSVGAEGGDIDLTSSDTHDVGDDIVIPAGATLYAPKGDIRLEAGDDFAFAYGASITAGGGVYIHGDAADADPGVGSMVQVDGSILGSSMMIVTGEDADVVSVRSTDLDVKALDILLGSGDDLMTLAALGRSTAAVIDGGEGDDVFDIGAIGTRAENVPIALVLGGRGSNTVNGPDSSNRWEITRTNEGVVSGPNTFKFLEVQTLRGGRLDDVFVFDDGATLDGTVDGRGGANTLDYSRYTSPVEVDFRTGTATGVLGGLAGGIANIDDVIFPDGNRKKK
ncbi:MAG: hypothetical protein JWN86_3431 [Planctomycetota bacterium]|nr:hypothetical protein [Planctomycetota bacterium]